jgi:hypothetical protein
VVVNEGGAERAAPGGRVDACFPPWGVTSVVETWSESNAGISGNVSGPFFDSAASIASARRATTEAAAFNAGMLAAGETITPRNIVCKLVLGEAEHEKPRLFSVRTAEIREPRNARPRFHERRHVERSRQIGRDEAAGVGEQEASQDTFDVGETPEQPSSWVHHVASCFRAPRGGGRR